MSSVIILVNGGCASFMASPKAKVVIIDQDNISSGDAPPILSGTLLAWARLWIPDMEGEFYNADES